MLCKKVSKLLSEFFDGVLDADMSVRISQHLKQCENCSVELDRLSVLHRKLNSIDKIPAPDYLYHMVQVRLANKKKSTWYDRMKDALALHWSRIRTTEVQFFWTRPLGTLMATLCFCFISLSIDPFNPGNTAAMDGRSNFSQEYQQEFIGSFRSYFHRPSLEQIIKDDQIGPAMDMQSLISFGERFRESVSDKKDNDFKLVTKVDSSGTANTISWVSPEVPVGRDLLPVLNQVIEEARYRPARKKGRSVSSWLVVIFNGITVYDE